MPQIDVSKLSAQLGDLRVQAATIADEMQALADEDVKLVMEFNELDPENEENAPRIEEITGRRAEINDEHKKKGARLKVANAKRDATQEAYERAMVGNAMDNHLAQPAGVTVTPTPQRVIATTDPATVGDPAQQPTADPPVHVNVLPPTEKELGQELGMMVRIIAASGGDRHRSVALANEWGNDRVRLAMEASSFTSGGFIVPANYMPALIDKLYARTVVRAMGVQILPLVNGSLKLPKLTSGASAYYIGEGQNIPKSEAAGGTITWTARRLVALVPISNELLRYSSPRADEMVRNNLVRETAIAEDTAFLRGLGSGNGPMGLRYQAPSAHVTASAGTTIANVTSDATALEAALLTDNVPMTKPTWIMAPRSATYLKNLRTTNGDLAFPEMSAPIPAAASVGRGRAPDGMFRGYPYYHSTQVPINLTDGGGTNESELYLVDAEEIGLAEDDTALLQASDTAAYYDGSALQSTFSRDETAIRAIFAHDLQALHAEAIAVKNQVTYGA